MLFRSVTLYVLLIFDAPHALTVSALVNDNNGAGVHASVTVPPAATNPATVVNTAGAFEKHKTEAVGGQMITGAVISLTVIVCVQFKKLRQASVTL